MSAFTDADLKRMKSAPFDTCEWVMDFDKMQALLARLEAAEQVADQHAMAFPNCIQVEIWRNAAGK